jgi:hypothetical protein
MIAGGVFRLWWLAVDFSFTPSLMSASLLFTCTFSIFLSCYLSQVFVLFPTAPLGSCHIDTKVHLLVLLAERFDPQFIVQLHQLPIHQLESIHLVD